MSRTAVLALLAVLIASGAAHGGPQGTLMDRFRIDQDASIMRPENFGIANGRITVGIEGDDIAGVGGIWAPPYVSSDFSLQVSLAEEDVEQPQFLWGPFYIDRSARLDNGVLVRTHTLLVPGERAFIFSMGLENAGTESITIPVGFRVSGSLDKLLSDANWGFMAPQSTSATQVEPRDGNMVVLRQGEEGIAITASQPLAWDGAHFSGNVPVAAMDQARLYLTCAIGPGEEAVSRSAALCAAPEAATTAAHGVYEGRVADLYERLPRLESDNPSLARFYDRSLTPFLMNRWDVPEFRLKPFYATGSVRGGCVGEYLWNVGECAEVLSLFDPVAAKAHIRQFLETGIESGFGFCPINGERMHPNHYYPVNQEKLIALAYHYVRNTGDLAFLRETIGDRTILDAIVAESVYLDDLSKPVELIDYNTCDPQGRGGHNHLELRTPLGELNYTNVMPDLNGRRYEKYVLAARLSELAGRPRPDLLERAESLKILLKEQLWDSDARWFVFKMPDADPPVVTHRYTVQMYYMLGTGVLDNEEESGLLSHLNEAEFLSDYGLHSLAKHDPAYHQPDVDNGGPGSCTCFPTNIAKTLYLMGKPALADDILRRILWWGEKMPYWGDSFYADAIRYREDTPLQCTLDAVTGAQCIIFGLFGIQPRFDGGILINPAMPSFAKEVSLTGVKMRGHTFDVALRGARYTVACQGKTVAARVGQRVLIAQGTPAIAE